MDMTNGDRRPACGKWLLGRRLLSARGGATAVETALTLPLLLAFLLGIEELGRLLWTQTALQYAVEAAARCAAVLGSNCSPSVTQYAANHVFGLSVPASNFTYTSSASCGISGYTSGSQVSLQGYAFQPLVPLNALAGFWSGGHGSPLNITLNASSCHP